MAPSQKPRQGGGKLRFSLKDRRVQLAIAGAAGLGLVALYVRTRTGAGGDAAAETPSGQVIQPATFDSTGADVYNALQSLGQSWTNQLTEIGTILGTVSDKLDKIPPAGSNTNTTTNTTNPAPKPPPKSPAKPAAKPAAQYVTVAKYTTRNPAWNSTLSGIAAHYKTTVANLLRLNPSIKNPNLIYPGQKIRVK